jgi:hypothetical protein
MTRSIFDPEGGRTEHSGSTHMGAEASEISHLPPDVVDGEVGEEDGEEPGPFTEDHKEAAHRLARMLDDQPQQPT